METETEVTPLIEKKPSGAQRKKDTRERVLIKGVWCLPKDETRWTGLRGKVK